ncbi:hypothetical protein LOZ58_006004 [Ophidiomyces ophidiicola]|nr:hypothetical protein LOZ58_006004 [Ophidiomyces ophidiicola]
MASHGDTTESVSTGSCVGGWNGHRTYKSFKRKFAKLKIKFELSMKESTSLVMEELRIIDLSKRLKEQNDQLLELLLELNSSIRIPRHFRYDLSVPAEPLPKAYFPGSDSLPELNYDPITARQKLREAREKLVEGSMSITACQRLEESMSRSDNFIPALRYVELLKTPHTVPANAVNLTLDEDIDAALGFLSPEHDLEYTKNLDSGSGFTRSGDKPMTAEREREIILRNPTSMYNWLRKNDPSAFQEADTLGFSEKSLTLAKSAATRTSKRAAAQGPKDDKVFEDDILLEVEPELGRSAGRNKRRRDDDGGYRPKGGNGGRGRKKKEDGVKRRKGVVTPTI